MRCNCFPLLSDRYAAALVASAPPEHESECDELDSDTASEPWTAPELPLLPLGEFLEEDDMETARTRPIRLDRVSL